MQRQDMEQLQEKILGVSVLVEMVRKSLTTEGDSIDKIDEAHYALKTIDRLFTQLLDDCDRFSQTIT